MRGKTGMLLRAYLLLAVEKLLPRIFPDRVNSWVISFEPDFFGGSAVAGNVGGGSCGHNGYGGAQVVGFTGGVH